MISGKDGKSSASPPKRSWTPGYPCQKGRCFLQPTAGMHPAIGSARAAYLLPLWLHRSRLPGPPRSSQPASENRPACPAISGHARPNFFEGKIKRIEPDRKSGSHSYLVPGYLMRSGPSRTFFWTSPSISLILCLYLRRVTLTSSSFSLKAKILAS